MLAKEKTQHIDAKNGYTLHLYNSKFNAGLAEMWNESDHQWPGTFTRGIPFTEERVEEWMERVTAIVKYIAVAPDGKVVGYGDLWENLERPKSAYVALLNVHPEHQGKSLARKMLTEMVNWATTNGYDRVTIGTWPANLKAMPLYKKVGFFWEPGTNVHMENYIPAVRQLPIAQDFFERHHWYQTYDRALKQVEDDMRHPMTGNMKVYILRWKADQDVLEAVFDRNAQCLTGIKTNDFEAYAQVETSEPTQGVLHTIRWQLINNSKQTQNITMLVNGNPGIQIDQRETLTLKPGEHHAVEGSFRCALDAPGYDTDSYEKPTPRIKTLVVINGQVLEFGTGLRYRPAVEISLAPEAVSLLPGQEQTVYVEMRNRTGQPFSGTVRLNPVPSVEMDWLSNPISIAANSAEGIPLVLTANKAGEVPLTARIDFADGDETISTKPTLLPIMVLPPGGLAVGKGEDSLVVENDYFRLNCKTKGGETKIWNKALRQNATEILEELGPPFVPWDMYTRKYELDVQEANGTVKVLMTARSGRFPGITVQREITVTAAPLLSFRHWITNQGDTPRAFQVRPRMINFQSETNEVIIPLKERVVRENTGVFWPLEGDVPKKPEQLSAPWVAFETGDQVTGLVWPGKVEEQLASWAELFLISPTHTLIPQAGFWTEPTYLYVGPGSWHQVEKIWKRLAGKKISRPGLAELPQPDRYFDYQLTPNPLVGMNGRVEVRLLADSLRKYPLEGEIQIQAPTGWTASQTVIPVTKLDRENSIDEPVAFETGTPEIGAYEGKLHFNTQIFDDTRSFTLLQLGDESQEVNVTEAQHQDQPVWRVENGRCEWVFTPAFHGGMVSWRETGQETEHLFSSFPKDGELSWMKPWFGGLRPTLHDPVKGHGWPGKLHEETFQAQRTAETDGRGLRWEGVVFTSLLQREVFQGLEAEIAYLTLGGSNVLKTVYRLINHTGVHRKAEPGYMAFLQPDGAYQHSVIYGEGFQQKRTQQNSWTTVGSWAAVENPETQRAIVAVNARGWQRIQTTGWGANGGHLNIYETIEVPPHDCYEMVAYLALVPNVEMAKRYNHLKLL